ncbi:MAG: SAM-dependent methyltransferase [Streptosporangiaceae bacterium]
MSDIDGIDSTVATAARMYDYYLGGKDHFPVDREAAEAVLRAAPEVRLLAVENRRFVQRAVRYLAEQGVRQFLDIGAGLPTQGNVHEIAHEENLDAHVVYVDNDPIVLSHARALLAEHGTTAVIQADLRDPASILDNRQVRELLDFDQPIALMFCAILHFVPDADRPGDLIEAYKRLLAPGSHLVLSHVTGDSRPQQSQGAADAYKNTKNPATLRSKETVTGFFDGFELVEPGVTYVPAWRPDEPSAVDPTLAWMLGGVGRRR